MVSNFWSRIKVIQEIQHFSNQLGLSSILKVLIPYGILTKVNCIYLSNWKVWSWSCVSIITTLQEQNWFNINVNLFHIPKFWHRMHPLPAQVWGLKISEKLLLRKFYFGRGSQNFEVKIKTVKNLYQYK